MKSSISSGQFVKQGGDREKQSPHEEEKHKYKISTVKDSVILHKTLMLRLEELVGDLTLRMQ